MRFNDDGTLAITVEDEFNLVPSKVASIDDYQPGFMQYVSSVFDDTLTDNIGNRAAAQNEFVGMKYGGADVLEEADSIGLTDVADYAQSLTNRQTEVMSVDAQAERIKQEGLEGDLKPDEGYTAEQLDWLIARRHEYNTNKIAREQASDWYAPAGFVVGMGASMLDPINVAASFVPIVSATRELQWLGRAATAGERAAVRAGVGAVEGAVGAVPVELGVWASASNLQDEYTLMDGLGNVVLGTAFSAALRPLTGAVGDAVRRHRGQRNPWEFVPVTDDTEALRTNHANKIWEAMQESGAPNLTREHADAAAALYDANARAFAYDTGTELTDFYGNYDVKWEGTGIVREYLPAPISAVPEKVASIESALADFDIKEEVPDVIYMPWPEGVPQHSRRFSRLKREKEKIVASDAAQTERDNIPHNPNPDPFEMRADTARAVARDLADADSLAEFLDGVDTDNLIRDLRRDNYLRDDIEPSRSNDWMEWLTDTQGHISDKGKEVVTHIVREHVIGHVPDVPAETLRRLDDALPVLASLKLRGDAWDLGKAFTAALRDVAERAKGNTPAKVSDTVDVLSALLRNAEPKEISARIRMYQDLANNGGTPRAKAFAQAFFEPLITLNGKGIPYFDKSGVPTHRALEYAHGVDVKSHSVDVTKRAIERRLNAKSPRFGKKKRAQLERMYESLKPYSGTVAKYDAPLPDASAKDMLFQRGKDGIRKGAVRFDGKDSFAVVEFFQAADASTAPHELYHVFRRTMADTYNHPHISPEAKHRYEKACEFVGAKVGEEWTEAMEEKFADAASRFLLEGISPHVRYDGLFESMKQWMTEVYGSAERSGLEISDSMREVFKDSLGNPMLGDMEFRYALGSLLSEQNPEQRKATVAAMMQTAKDAVKNADIELHGHKASETLASAEERLNADFAALSDKPEALADYREQFDAEMAEIASRAPNKERTLELSKAMIACLIGAN